MTILDDAAKAVESRDTSYGTPADNHGRTAAMWAAYLGVPVTAHDVCMLNILQKASRSKCDPAHRDNLVDIAGYARNAEMVAAPPEEPVDYAAKFAQRCVKCGSMSTPRRAIAADPRGLKFDVIEWPCTCGNNEIADRDALVMTDPEYRRI